jgi:sec-independent protein translocase protein TatC
MNDNNAVSDSPMTFLQHLEEFRTRILIAVAAILLATAVAFFLSQPLLNILLLPAGGMKLNAFDIMDGFMIKWRIALYTGITIAFPVWAYELYVFISPALLPHEKKIVFPVLLGSLTLFSIGAVFGFYLLYGMVSVLVKLFPNQVNFLPSADSYISFVIFFLLACGLAFQLPVLLTLLVQFRVLSASMLRKQRRIAYFVLFVFAEIITPVSDPIVAPLTVMVPMILLYELSIFFATRIEAGRKNENLETTT